ncbi:MAG: glycoside hydrolase family 3 N-terminal domain-containing protein [Microthrixaceae bacterium]
MDDSTQTPDPNTSASDIVAALDLTTRIRLLSGHGFWALRGVPGHGLSGVVVSDGPHGLRCQVKSADHLGVAPAQPATCFPTAAALGSSWDPELLALVGAAIGDEARSLGVSVVLGPGLNLKRHPAGGRSFEYFSEDPLLSGKLAAAMVRGIQVAWRRHEHQALRGQQPGVSSPGRGRSDRRAHAARALPAAASR